MLMDKWSTKPPDHNANRVRNNQRRHRARVKSRMEELETRLQETNEKLEAALSTISSLKAEVETLRSSQSSPPDPLVGPRLPVVFVDPSHPEHPHSSATYLQQPDEATPLSTVISESFKHDIIPASAVLIVSSDTNCDCQGAPPPALGESTISCSSAFQMIDQQNFNRVEAATIKAWLGPGFRLRPGEACRVVTNKLYEILDNITSPS